MTYTVLDLFAGLGGFSSAFADSDRWDVTTVDIKERFDPDIKADVFDLRPSDFDREFDVILASPPCTKLSTAGNHDLWDYDRREPTGDASKDAVALFYHTIGLIRGLAPRYWYIENPRRSRISWFVGKPDHWVSYCQYGKDYQKDTGLWGRHAPRMTYKKCTEETGCHVSNTENDGSEAIQSMPSDPGERAKVPYELSAAILEACEAGLNGAKHEQRTIDEVLQ